MKLVGWNHVPEGYGARFEVRTAPFWLGVLFHIPIIDRFAYPLLVGRGHGYLQAFPDPPPQGVGDVPDGWRIAPPDYQPPGSIARLT